MSERKPLLPQHRFSQQPISFPSAGADEAQAAGGGESAGQPTTGSLQHRIRTMSEPPERKPGTPKVTREVRSDSGDAMVLEGRSPIL